MPKKRLVLIAINPAAGKSSYEAKLGIIEKMLHEREIDYKLFFTEHNHFGQLSSTINSNLSISEIFVIGGDGTLNYVVNEIKGAHLPVSIISNGTGNDSVKSIHGVLDFKKQVDIALHGKVKAFDLGICNERYFVNGVGIGFDGEIVKEMVEHGKKRGRHIDYLLTVLRILGKFKERGLYFSLDEKVFQQKILLMTISNGTTFGGGFIINPYAKTDDGLLDICIFNKISPLKRFWHLPKLKTGSHTKIKYTEFYQAEDIRIKKTDELVAHLDGEYIGHPPFNISVRKGSLFVRVPTSFF